MTDAFLDRVARHLCEVASTLGKISGVLYEVASLLRDVGQDGWADKCKESALQIRRMAGKSREIALQVFEDTPIEGPMPTAKRPTGKYTSADDTDVGGRVDGRGFAPLDPDGNENS